MKNEIWSIQQLYTTWTMHMLAFIFATAYSDEVKNAKLIAQIECDSLMMGDRTVKYDLTICPWRLWGPKLIALPTAKM